MKYTIHQGDEFGLPLGITRNGTIQTSSEIEKLEIILAGIRKEYPGEVTWNSEKNKFIFPLSQEETLAMKPGEYDLMIRPLFAADDAIIGWITVDGIKVVAMRGAEIL